MRDNEIISNGSCAGFCRVARGVLKCAPGLVLALMLGVVEVSAQQGERAKPSSGGEQGATAGELRRARRVGAAGDASVRKDEESAIVAPEKASGDARSNTKSDIETEEESPAPDDEARGTGRLVTLRAQIKDAQTELERARLRRTLVDYLVALDQKKEAIAELRLMSKDERFDPVGFYNIGNALARLGDTDTAVEAYRKAINQRRGHYSRALNNLGVVLLRQGRWDEAREALTSALRQEAGRYAEASYNLGRLYSLRGEADLAIREWSRVLALQPDHADATLALARAYAEDGNPERALAVIDSFTSRRGTNNELAAVRREILYDTEAYAAGDSSAVVKTSDSAPAAKTALASNNSSVTVSPASASNSTNAGVSSGTNKSSAIGVSKKTTEGGSRTSSAPLRSLSVDRETYDLLERARAARESGKAQEAAGFYHRVLSRRGGFFPPANLEISFVLSDLNRHEEAIASLQKLIAREGARYPIAYFHLGRQYEALGQLNSAAEAYSRAAAAYGEKEPQFLLDVSRVREKEGNIAAALSAMEEYARIGERRGRTPEWTAGRISELRQKQQDGAAKQK